jgi:putative oxidoreductase
LKTLNPTNLLLRLALAAILLMHSIPGMFNGEINAFGTYLDAVGFTPVGLYVAWAIKLSHVGAAICFMLRRFTLIAGVITNIIFITGIFMVHLKEGWYVVGGGFNGIEFNILLIAVVTYLMFYDYKRTTN